MTRGKRGLPLDQVRPNFGGREEIGEKGKREERERGRRRREKLHLLSKFDGDRIIGFHRSKRQSSSTPRGFRIETKIGEFRQVPRGRGFLLLGLILV